MNDTKHGEHGPRAQAENTLASGIVQSLHRGLQVLDLVVQSREPIRLSEIARELTMDRASAFRLLQTLEQNGLVAKNPASKNYSVGGKLLQWVSIVGDNGNLVSAARPFLAGLVSKTNESGHFGVLSKDRALLLDYINSTGTIVVQNRVGVFEPLYCTALGKALLAFQQETRRNVLMSGIKFVQHTDRTVVGRENLELACATVRDEAVAFDDGEYDSQLFCVASPVLGCDGNAIGALGVSMVRPIAIGAPEHRANVAQEVRNVARGMTESIGGPEVAQAVFGNPSADTSR